MEITEQEKTRDELINEKIENIKLKYMISKILEDTYKDEEKVIEVYTKYEQIADREIRDTLRQVVQESKQENKK